MNTDSDLDWLYARQRFGVHPGLSRVRSLLARLGDPQTNFRAVLVGGTNGKGSTASTLSAMLNASGLRTALFTSPHLTRFTERFVVAGQELSAEAVQVALARVRPHAETMRASFFEIVTALGCLLFAEAGVELAVMEVGLGGRLDATNALEPVLSVITTIGLDHTAILGETLALIAAEKAGILRAGRPAVTGVQPELLPILDKRGTDLWALGREAGVQTALLGWDGAQVRLTSPVGDLSFRTPLLGEHGACNAALAALAAQRLGVSEQAIQRGAAHSHWPGRLERLPWRGGGVLLDGAHNPDGARALRQALITLAAPPLPVIFGAASDKDARAMLAELAPLMSSLVLTRSALSPRAASPEALAALAPPGVPVQLAASPEAALALLPAGGLSLVCGSLYLIGELRPLLTGETNEGRERWQ
ncbi:folylpolyglutamate synthase/dihydrofolate synthase family protein [Deinococcus sp.]|uniref:bifunctional folylpolyglutamate synthase/dihydrofolate synthase n=1 Tax=Deinococcus sp. TaxID=47478 RepID=UPI0025E3D98D|nr:folylpolyglutamate synthase/dihydrofolate synthase family protein [Deinococcus sp.]